MVPGCSYRSTQVAEYKHFWPFLLLPVHKICRVRTVTGANAGKVTLLTMDGDGGYDISVLVNM